MGEKNIKGVRTNEGTLKIDYDSLDNLPTIPSEANQIGYVKGEVTNVKEALDTLSNNALKYLTYDEIDIN